ncbi:MAG: Tar ligand binding domain-containing protein, partial [Alphaproteobacteria bacterium]|nr:Tar ligand binding domain-containing protein [Alphaproteobacteria bacterium]
MKALANIRVATKVYGGFGTVLALLVVVAVVAFFGLNGANDNFGDYRGLARQTNAAGRVQANMLETRLQVKNFIID